MHFRVFSKGQATVLGIFFGGGYFFGLVKFQFLGCLKFLIFLGGTVDAGSEPTYEEKMRIPLPPGAGD